MQNDRNLCVYRGWARSLLGHVWESRTAKDGGSGNYRAALQPDGNFCIYDNGEWVWDIQTSAAVRYGSAFYAVLENDGNLCIYRGRPFEDTDSCGVQCQ